MGTRGCSPVSIATPPEAPIPSTRADFGDGLLMKEGYTLVFVGWELGLSAPKLGVSAPPVMLPPGFGDRSDRRRCDCQRADDRRRSWSMSPVRPPVIYAPADMTSPTDRLTVRDLFWNEPIVIPRERWRFLMDSNGVPMLHLDGGFEPGRWYRVTYRPSRPVVAGVGLAAIRDAAAAFRYRSDLPVHGRALTCSASRRPGASFVNSCTTASMPTSSDRRVFDAVWVHIAGAARGSFNERFATPSHGDMFESTRFPFADAEQTDVGRLARRPAVSLSPRSAPEGVLHEHAGGVLGRRAGGGADARQRRWHPRPRLAGPRSDVSAGGHPARLRPVPSADQSDRARLRRGGTGAARPGAEQSDTADHRDACAASRVARVGIRRRGASAEPVSSAR